MKAADACHPDALPRVYAAWRCRTLAGAIVATAVGLVVQGPTGEFRADFGGEWPSPWLLLGLVAVVVGSFGPGMVGAGLALAAVWSWRRLGTSSRFARAAWVLWVLGPLPVLLLPVSHLFNLNLEDSLKTSTTQVRHLFTVIAPALFALLPGTLRAALVLERFLPESRARSDHAAGGSGLHGGLPTPPGGSDSTGVPLGAVPGPIAPCQFAPRPAAGGPLAASPQYAEPGNRLLAPSSWSRERRHLGVAPTARWLGEHPLLQTLLGQINAVWVVGLVAKVLASKWLTEVVVTDLLLSMLHQGRESAQSLVDTAEGEALAQKLDALGHSLRPAGPTKG